MNTDEQPSAAYRHGNCIRLGNFGLGLSPNSARRTIQPFKYKCSSFDCIQGDAKRVPATDSQFPQQ